MTGATVRAPSASASRPRGPWLDGLFSRSYRRLRRRYVGFWLAVTAGGILLLAWPAQFLTERPLWGPGPGDRRAFLVSMACGTAVVVVLTVRTIAVHYRPVVAFLHGKAVDPTDVWHAAVRRLPRAALEFTVAFCLFGDVPTLVAIGHARGFGPMEYAAGWLVAVIITAAAGSFFVLIWEVAFRPVLRDVQPLLPVDFEPGTSRLTLSRRSALASASAMAYTGAAVSSLVAGETDRDRAIAVALLGALGSACTFGGVITGLVSHSIYMRVDELKDALVRIGRREFGVRVAVRAGDELDEAGANLNRMAVRLETADSELRASRERLASVADDERRRMERDLRDRVLTRLHDIADELADLGDELGDDPDLAARCALVRRTVDDAVTEIQRLARGVYPAELTRGDLAGALRAAAVRMPGPTTTSFAGLRRLDARTEAAVYFCCREALANAAKHAGEGAAVAVEVRVERGRVHFSVSDDGPGFAGGASGSGLQNMRDRMGALGGDLEVHAEPGHGTTVAGWVPLRPYVPDLYPDRPAPA